MFFEFSAIHTDGFSIKITLWWYVFDRAKTMENADENSSKMET